MPDIQAVLNATAQIAGGAVTTQPGVYQGAGGITGVKIAYSLPPEQSQLNEQGAAHVSWCDHLQLDPAGQSSSDFTTFQWRIRMQLMIAIGLSDLPHATAILTPFVPLYVAAFATNLSLKGSCSVSRFDPSSGLVPAIYPDRLAWEFILIATQKESVTYGL